MPEPLAPALLDWYRRHRRDLPWRRNPDPYAVWVSEIMLQQTTVAAVIPYFERWMGRFPTVETLAAASDEDALALWQGLGYYRRCRNLLAGARIAAEQGLPKNAAQWMELPGIGRYTAGAIASISQGEAVPLVDGNVERVFARLTGSEKCGPDLTKAAWQWAEEHLNHQSPGDWNQALMELGATLCTPKKPSCGSCPVSGRCTAFVNGDQDRLPIPKPRREFVRRHHVIWVPLCDGLYGVRQTPEGEWWAGLWSFPWAIEMESGRLEALLPTAWPEEAGTFQHTVTHHKIRADVFLVRCEGRSEGLIWRSASELADLALPSPQRRALKMAQALLGLSPTPGA